MFLPDSIDLEKSDKYVLSIRIKPDGFMFSIHEPGNEKNYCLRETSFSAKENLLDNIQRIIFELSFLTQEYKRTNVVIVSKEYDLIPAAYFDAREKNAIYDFTHLDKSEHLLSGLIEKQNIISVFNLKKDVFEFLSRNLWNPDFFHHTNLFLNLLEKKEIITETKTKMYINFHDNIMDIFCFSGSKLLLCQTYEGEPSSNQVYYILKLWEQFKFNQLEDYLYIAGSPDEIALGRLQEYIKHIEQINTPSEVFFWGEDAQKAPLDLLALSL